jgi:hypothetical protein
MRKKVNPSLMRVALGMISLVVTHVKKVIPSHRCGPFRKLNAFIERRECSFVHAWKFRSGRSVEMKMTRTRCLRWTEAIRDHRRSRCGREVRRRNPCRVAGAVTPHRLTRRARRPHGLVALPPQRGGAVSIVRSRAFPSAIAGRRSRLWLAAATKAN